MKKITVSLMLLSALLLSLLPISAEEAKPADRTCYASLDFDQNTKINANQATNFGNGFSTSVSATATTTEKVADAGNAVLHFSRSGATAIGYDFVAYEDSRKTLPDTFTVQFDLKLGSTFYSTTGKTGYPNIYFFKRLSTGFMQMELLKVSNASGSLIIPGNSSDTGSYRLICTLSQTEYTNLALTFTSDNWSVWVNGVKKATNSYKVTGLGTSPAEAVTGLRIGSCTKTLYDFDFYIDHINVYAGDSPISPTATADLKCQESEVTDGKYNVRFIATVDSLDYSKVGFLLHTVYSDGTETKNADYSLESTWVYQSVSADFGESTYSAPSGKYLMVLTVKDIPAELETVSFTVTSYTVVNGMTTFGAKQTFTYCKGIFQES